MRIARFLEVRVEQTGKHLRMFLIIRKKNKTRKPQTKKKISSDTFRGLYEGNEVCRIHGVFFIK